MSIGREGNGGAERRGVPAPAPPAGATGGSKGRPGRAGSGAERFLAGGATVKRGAFAGIEEAVPEEPPTPVAWPMAAP